MAVATYAARKPQSRYIPAFTVFKAEGDYTRTVAKMVPVSDRKDKNGNLKYKLDYETVVEPKGWIVTFPKGHSVHFATYEALEAGGFTDTEVPLVDEDGEAVGSVPNVTRRAKKQEVIDA